MCFFGLYYTCVFQNIYAESYFACILQVYSLFFVRVTKNELLLPIQCSHFLKQTFRWLLVFAIIKKDLNIHVSLGTRVRISLGYIPRSSIIVSWYVSTSYFTKFGWSVFKNDYLSVPIVPHPCQHLGLPGLVSFASLKKTGMVSHFGSNFNFPNY